MDLVPFLLHTVIKGTGRIWLDHCMMTKPGMCRNGVYFKLLVLYWVQLKSITLVKAFNCCRKIMREWTRFSRDVAFLLQFFKASHTCFLNLQITSLIGPNGNHLYTQCNLTATIIQNGSFWLPWAWKCSGNHILILRHWLFDLFLVIDTVAGHEERYGWCEPWETRADVAIFTVCFGHAPHALCQATGDGVIWSGRLSLHFTSVSSLG